MEYMIKQLCNLSHVEVYALNSFTRGHEIIPLENFGLGVGGKTYIDDMMNNNQYSIRLVIFFM